MQSYYSSILQRPVSEQTVKKNISNLQNPEQKIMINETNAVLKEDIVKQEMEPLMEPLTEISLGSAAIVDPESLEHSLNIEAIDFNESLKRKTFSTAMFNFGNLFSIKTSNEHMKEEILKDMQNLRLEEDSTERYDEEAGDIQL